MIEKERVIKMTKAALYEQKEKTHALYRLHFFKKDYVTFHMLIVWICITAAFVILSLIGLLCLTESPVNYSLTQWISFGIMAMVLYITAVVVYMISAWNIYSGRYEESEKSAKAYEAYLAELKLKE